MTVIVSNIIPAKIVATTQEKQYTSMDAKTIIDKLSVTNVDPNDADISIWLVEVGDSPINGNLIVDSRVLAPDETYNFPEIVGQVLENGGMIYTQASAANALTISSAGRQIS